MKETGEIMQEVDKSLLKEYPSTNMQPIEDSSNFHVAKKPEGTLIKKVSKLFNCWFILETKKLLKLSLPIVS